LDLTSEDAEWLPPLQNNRCQTDEQLDNFYEPWETINCEGWFKARTGKYASDKL